MPTYTNLCILQGWFEVESARTVVANRSSVLVVEGRIHTTDRDGIEAICDDHHPVVVSGRPAEVIIDIMRKVKEKPLIEAGVCLIEIASVSVDQPAILVNQARPYVIAQGKLINHNGRSFVDIKHISFLGLPWGGLDMLAKQKQDQNARDQSLIQETRAIKRRQMKRVVA